MTRLDATILASAVTAPFASLFGTLVSSPTVDWSLLPTFLLGIVPALIACCLVIGTVGVVTSVVLERLNRDSRAAYILAGVGLSSAAIAAALLYDWCCLRPGPFQTSFHDRLKIFGAGAVAWHYLQAFVYASICGAVAASAFWTFLRKPRSNQRLERP